MAVQQQEQQNNSLWWDDEEEEPVRTEYHTKKTVARKPEQRKKKSPVGKILAGAAAIAVALTGMVFYNRTPAFADTAAPEGYLPLEEYLYLNENGDPEGSLMNPFYEGGWVYYGEEEVYTTTKGITVGSTWDDFVEAYGQYTAYSISVVPEEDIPYDERPDSYYDEHYFDFMKVEDFDREYIKTGKVDLSTNTVYVEFTVYVYGRHAAYTEKQYEQVLDLHSSNNMPDGSIFDPKLQHYCLDFTFSPKDTFWDELPEDGTLNYISYDHYAY
jgi:hypothetical protein